MPKSAKKRKDKAADFSKAKLKLGKGKQLAANAIDTSFKARSIALPTQSIVVEKTEDAPTTKRRLTLDDLLVHIKHYSAGTRKDAILGLREILDAHWELLDSSLTPLINACVRIIGDEDASVRKVLLSFFAWLLPRIPQEDLVPHTPLLFLFTTSAQTHIFPEIRIDAIRFLDVFMECFTGVVTAGWNQSGHGHGSRILEGYLGILNAGTKFGEKDGPLKATSTASVVLTPGSKLVVLRSLSTFLLQALSLSSIAPPSSSDTSNSLNLWCLATSFSGPEVFESFDKLLQPSDEHSGACDRRTWEAEVNLEENNDDFPSIPWSTNNLLPSDSWGLQDLNDVAQAIGNSDSENGRSSEFTFTLHLTRTLHSTLVATFLDSAPSVFSPTGSPSETEMDLILAVTQIARSLYSAILQDSITENLDPAIEDLRSLLGYMSPYFPFRPSGSRDIKREQAFQDMNLIFCELTSLLVLARERKTHSPHGKVRQTKKNSARADSNNDALSAQSLRVSEYIVQLLQGESVATSQLGKPLTPAAYTALLPTIWALLNYTTQHNLAGTILRATVEHALKTSSKSAVKRLTLELMTRLVLLDTEPQYRGAFRLGRDPEEDEKLEDWLTHLPQCLWEMGASNLPATEIILRFLLRAVQRKSKIIHAKTIASLRSRLVPYFSITHAVRGQLLGPYGKPTSPLRRLALDLVVAIGQPGSNDPLFAAVDLAVQGTLEDDYWTQVRKFASQS